MEEKLWKKVGGKIGRKVVEEKLEVTAQKKESDYSLPTIEIEIILRVHRLIRSKIFDLFVD